MNGSAGNPCPVKRGDIDGFSAASRRRLTFALANHSNGDRAFLATTLTYHEAMPFDGRVAKAHLRSFLQNLDISSKKGHFGHDLQGDLQYLWVMEFQARGAVHFHLYTNLSPTSEASTCERIGQMWHSASGETTQEHSEFHCHAKNFMPWVMDTTYPAKYLGKGSQKNVPESYTNCGRFWGCSRGFVAPGDHLSGDALGDALCTPLTGITETGFLRIIRKCHAATLRQAYKAGTLYPKVTEKIRLSIVKNASRCFCSSSPQAPVMGKMFLLSGVRIVGKIFDDIRRLYDTWQDNYQLYLLAQARRSVRSLTALIERGEMSPLLPCYSPQGAF